MSTRSIHLNRRNEDAIIIPPRAAPAPPDARFCVRCTIHRLSRLDGDTCIHCQAEPWTPGICQACGLPVEASRPGRSRCASCIRQARESRDA